MNLFGKKKAAPAAVNPAQTIMQLRGTLETLEKREAHLQTKIDQQTGEAKAKLAAKDKRGALFCMKRKKMFEKEIEKLQGARANLEQQIINLENAQSNILVYQSLKAGASQMKAVHKQMDVDRIDEMMDDIQEEMATAEEISDAISRPISAEIYDEDELLQELEGLEEEQLEEAPVATKPSKIPASAAPAESKVPVAASGINFPDPPTHRPTAVKITGDVDEDELKALRDLEASMAM